MVLPIAFYLTSVAAVYWTFRRIASRRFPGNRDLAPRRGLGLHRTLRGIVLAATVGCLLLTIGAYLVSGSAPAAALTSIAYLSVAVPYVAAEEHRTRIEDAFVDSTGLNSNEPLYPPADWTA